MKNNGVIHFPKYINEVAAIIGKYRSSFNTDLKKKNERYDRGEKNEFVDTLGVKGELIFSHYLFSINTEHELTTLLSDNPISSYDIKIKDFYIDVKASRMDAKDIYVNKEAHDKCKGVTHYAFVQIKGDDVAHYWIYEVNEISKWEVRNLKFSDAYCLPIPPVTNV